MSSSVLEMIESERLLFHYCSGSATAEVGVAATR